MEQTQMDANPENEDLANQMKTLAESAVTLARNQHQANLNYSEESLKLVEHILFKLSEDVPKSWLGRLLCRSPSRNQIESICQIMGAYIGEVVRRKFNGTWHMDSTFGKALPALSVLGGNIYPTNKVYKRLIDGEGDNVWLYYQMLKHMDEHDPPDQQTQLTDLGDKR